jgi:hypothetical protein
MATVSSLLLFSCGIQIKMFYESIKEQIFFNLRRSVKFLADQDGTRFRQENGFHYENLGPSDFG